MLDSMRELRKILARAIDECESKRDLAALASRYAQVCVHVSELESKLPPAEESPADRFQARLLSFGGGAG
ncbi:UNVERIFIED_ORG: hypothetical protein M2328_006123 [Rhodococcus erythropolis]